MTRLAGMDKKGGGTGTGQGCRNLASDVSRLAHTGHNHTSLACQQCLAGAGKLFIKTSAQ